MNGNAVENPKWNSGSLSYSGMWQGIFFTSASLTWNCCRSPVRGTLHQLLLAWDENLAPLKSAASSGLTLPGPWCSATGGEQQHHASISQWPRTRVTNTTQVHGQFGTCSESHVIQMFWNNISGNLHLIQYTQISEIWVFLIVFCDFGMV